MSRTHQRQPTPLRVAILQPLLLIICAALLTACAATRQPQASTTTPDPAQLPAIATSPADVPAHTPATMHPPLNTATPTPVPRATVNAPSFQEFMFAAALAQLQVSEAIISGTPDVLLALPAYPDTIRQRGLNIGNWDPDCRRLFYLLILRGDFNGDHLIPGLQRNNISDHANYLALVFDLMPDAPGSVTYISLSDNGSAFKRILQDPTLPDPLLEDSLSVEPPYITCNEGPVYGE